MKEVGPIAERVLSTRNVGRSQSEDFLAFAEEQLRVAVKKAKTEEGFHAFLRTTLSRLAIKFFDRDAKRGLRSAGSLSSCDLPSSEPTPEQLLESAHDGAVAATLLEELFEKRPMQCLSFKIRHAFPLHPHELRFLSEKRGVGLAMLSREVGALPTTRRQWATVAKLLDVSESGVTHNGRLARMWLRERLDREAKR